MSEPLTITVWLADLAQFQELILACQDVVRVVEEEHFPISVPDETLRADIQKLSEALGKLGKEEDVRFF